MCGKKLLKKMKSKAQIIDKKLIKTQRINSNNLQDQIIINILNEKEK